MKKIVHQLSDDDLMDLATEAVDKEEIVERLTDTAKFIYEFKIKHGDSKIPAEVIYHGYKRWKAGGKKTPKPIFFQDFKKYFEQHRTAQGMCYLLSPEPFDLTEETWWIIRKEIRDEKTRQKSKKEKKST